MTRGGNGEGDSIAAISAVNKSEDEQNLQQPVEEQTSESTEQTNN